MVAPFQGPGCCISMNKYTKISIIVPSLNQGQFLERAIRSILNQNYPCFELIIVDGGSSDDTMQVINKYESFLSRWVSEPDRGQAHALNKGLRLLTGDFVGWMNADDAYWSNAFIEFGDIVTKHPEFDIYYANKVNIDEHDRILGRVKYARPAKGFMKFYAKYRGMTFCNQAAFFRSTVFRDVGDFDERFQIGMDLDLFFRCIMADMRFHHSNKIWGAWRRHDAAKTATNFASDPKRKAERELFERKHQLYRGPGWGALSLLAAVWRRSLLFTQ